MGLGAKLPKLNSCSNMKTTTKNEDKLEKKDDRMGDDTITLQMVFTYSHGIFSYAVLFFMASLTNLVQVTLLNKLGLFHKVSLYRPRDLNPC